MRRRTAKCEGRKSYAERGPRVGRRRRGDGAAGISASLVRTKHSRRFFRFLNRLRSALRISSMPGLARRAGFIYAARPPNTRPEVPLLSEVCVWMALI